MVQLTDMAYQKFKAAERAWRFVDHYCNPGPIQFLDYGSDFIADTIRASYEGETEVSD